MPPKKRKAEGDPGNEPTKPPPQLRVTRSRATRSSIAPFHITNRSKSKSEEHSVHASAQLSIESIEIEASKERSAEPSTSSTRRSSAQIEDVVESPPSAKRTRLAKKEVEVAAQTDSQLLDEEHSFPTLPSIEDFTIRSSGRGRKRRSRPEFEDAEKDLVDGEQSQETEPFLKRTRAQTRAVDSEADGVDSEQPQGSEPPAKKRRAPPVRTGPRKIKGRGRWRKKLGSELANFDDDPTMIALRERQAELKAAFEAIAAPHAAALAELAKRDIERLCRDKDAHMQVPEYEKVLEDLQDALAQRQEAIRIEYEYKKANAIKMYENEREAMQIHHHDNVRHVWHESLSGSIFDYMALVRGARQAQDDAATEVDEEEVTMPRENWSPRFPRGHNSLHVENSATLRAFQDWPDFIHREELRKAAGPSIHESQSESRRAIESDARNLDTLTVAGRTLEGQFPESSTRSTLQTAQDERSALDALVMLRDPGDGLGETNNYFQQSPLAKRTRQRSAIIKGKPRSGSVQGQRPLLPAPSAAPLHEPPMSPYAYNNPFMQLPPPIAGPPPSPYGVPPPHSQAAAPYHPLPPPPPSYQNHPLAALFMNPVIYPRPQQHMQPYYPPPHQHPPPPPPPGMVSSGPPSSQLSPHQQQPPTPRQA